MTKLSEYNDPVSCRLQSGVLDPLLCIWCLIRSSIYTFVTGPKAVIYLCGQDLNFDQKFLDITVCLLFIVVILVRILCVVTGPR